MNENSPFSMFGKAAQRPPKKVLKSKPPVQHVKKASPPPQTEVSAPTISGTAIANLDPEIQAMITRMRDMHKDIEGRLNKIYETSGLSPSQIKSFAENVSNFTPEEWRKLQSNRAEIEAKLLAFLGPRVKAEKQRLMTDKMTKERKAKTVAARKKNWIPMR